MTRKPRHELEQLKLFAHPSPRPAARLASWAARHWPDHVSLSDEGPLSTPAKPSKSSKLPKGSQKLLLFLGREAREDGTCRICLRALAQANNMGRNTCKRHVERLLAAGLLMMKVWTEPTICGPRLLGYEFRLIADAVEREAAVEDGFVSIRPMARANG